MALRLKKAPPSERRVRKVNRSTEREFHDGGTARQDKLKTTTRSYAGIVAAGLALIFAATAQAQDVEPFSPAPLPSASAPAVDQIIYKGVVGNLLEAVPLDPEKRVQLQRGNAVVSNLASARSLAMLLGVANPVLLVGGLVWGLWSASQIKPPQVAARPLDSLCVDTDVIENKAVSLVTN
jgi:hypothetical protein